MKSETLPIQPARPGLLARLARLPVAWIILLGVVLHLPSLGIGFYVDDYLHQLVLRGEAPMHPLALYDFGELADWTDREGDVGSFPWWSTPDWKARFFRPLSSATIWLDHAIFGDFALGYQLVSLGWLTGPPEDLERAAAAFAGPAPWMSDMF